MIFVWNGEIVRRKLVRSGGALHLNDNLIFIVISYHSQVFEEKNDEWLLK